jgi:mannosyltransferase
MTTGIDTVAATPSARAVADAAGTARYNRTRFRDWAVVLLPAAMAAGLCLYQIAGRSLGLDESASVAIASQHGGALGSAIAHDGGNMAGYYALLHVVIELFGNSTVVLRLPSAICAAATVAIVGLIALRLWNWRPALAAGLLTAVSLPLVFWGQAARGYAPMVALIAASFLAFVALVGGGGGTRPWLAYVVCTTLAMYAGFAAVLVVPAQLLVLLWRRHRWRPVASALLVSALFCVPLLVLALQRGAGQLFWVPRPGLESTKQVLEALTSAGLQPNFRAASTGPVLLAATLVLVAALAGAIVLRLRRSPVTEWGAALVLCWLLVPFVVALLESALGQSIFLPRNLLVSLPAVSLLLAYGIVDRRVPPVAAWSAVALLIALRALQLGPSYGVSPENWKRAASYVDARAEPLDCVAFYPSDGRMAFRYYLRSPRFRPLLPAAPWREVRPYVEDYVIPSRSRLARLTSTCPRLWLVTAHVGSPIGPSQSQANYAGYLTLRSRLSEEYGHAESEAFGYAPPVHVELFTGAASVR